MNQEELEKKVRHIQIHSRKAVIETLAGEYRSSFKGMGIEFEDVRQYQHGDDVRTIDWNVTARTGKPHVKQFMEERELTLFFLIDISASGNFTSVEKSKKDVASQIFALLAFAASHNNDNIGLILFSNEVELYIKPGKGKNHVLNMIENILSHEPKSRGTDLNVCLDFLRKVRRNRCVTFLFSDFMTEDFEDALSSVARNYDLVCVKLSDFREKELPTRGIIEIADSETGEVRAIDCTNKKLRENILQNFIEQDKKLQEFCLEIDADFLHVHTEEDYLHRLISFFRNRSLRSADAL
ncbi:MAG: DUF58 domain-containing protein [Lentisphaeraceae bacterium]|nr:DUF58 domain-containing protein [Lentisphaeraceae bacterium]